MEELLVVLNNNKPNRHNVIFPISTLVACVDQSWEYGVSMNIGHDMHRPIAHMRGLGLYLEPGLCRLLGLISFPQSSEEQNLIQEIHKANLTKNFISSAKNDYDKILSKFPHSNITCKNNLKPFKYECSAIIKEKLAEELFPNIFSQKDQDGLIDILLLQPFKPGLFRVGDLVLFAHPYFRRNLSQWNSYCVEFLDILQNLRTKNDIRIKIALDPNSIGLAESYKDRMEFEYWWGPKFTDDLSKIPMGMTQHVEVDRFKQECLEIEKTEFFWGKINGIKTFECEEVKNRPSLGVSDDFFGCRYVHSMLDDTGQNIAHIDGAIRGYNIDQITNRKQMAIDKLGRHTKYTKLWRIDGNVSVELWKELVCHYFRGNHLVGEYLGGVEPKKDDRPSIVFEEEDVPITQYIPTNLAPNQGIRICVSYQHKQDNIKQGVTIMSFDSFTKDEKKLKYIEHDTIELIKVLYQNIKYLHFYEEYSRVAFEDTVLNLPLFIHYGDNLNDLVQGTMNAIRTICEARRNVDQLISFSLGIIIGNKEIIFSFAAHISDLCKWFNSGLYALPNQEIDVKGWCDRIYAWISKEFTLNIDRPKLKEIVKTTGILKFERKLIDPRIINFSMDEGKVMCEILMPKDEVEKIQKCGLSVAPIMLVKKSRCSKTKKDYLQSKYSKYLHKDTHEILEDIEFLGSFWTNRHA